MPALPPAKLTDTQIDQLEAFLDTIPGAMGIEEIDGFFCALISGPDLVMPGEFLPYVFGGTMPAFGLRGQADQIMTLLLRHWDHIAATLLRDELYLPFLYEDDDGTCHANAWAHGYMLGVELRRDSWEGLIDDEDNRGLLMPAMALYIEQVEDPEYQSKPITGDKRKDIIADMTAAILAIYQCFTPLRMQELRLSNQCEPLKLRANDPCYCGSGKRFQHCHGDVALH